MIRNLSVCRSCEHYVKICSLCDYDLIDTRQQAEVYELRNMNGAIVDTKTHSHTITLTFRATDQAHESCNRRFECLVMNQSTTNNGSV